MNKEIVVLSIDKTYHRAHTKTLKIVDIEEILDFQEIILKSINDKDMYCETSKVEFEKYFKNEDTLIGIYTDEDGLIAMGVYASYGESEDNYGFDIGIRGEYLFKVGQIDSVAVIPRYRGNGLQKLICKELENVAIFKGYKAICTTIYPKNMYSINTFEALGYRIINEKEKYGGMRRYILVKNL